MANAKDIYVDKSLENLLSDPVLRKQLISTYTDVGEALKTYFDLRKDSDSVAYASASRRVCERFGEFLWKTGINSDLLGIVLVYKHILDRSDAVVACRTVDEVALYAYDSLAPFATFIKSRLQDCHYWRIKSIVECNEKEFKDIYIKLKASPENVHRIVMNAGSLDTVLLAAKLAADGYFLIG